jgi:hypothetical protein
MMRLKQLSVLTLITSIFTASIAAQEPVDAVMNAKIRDEGLNRSQVLKTFEHFTEVIGPRLTGSPAAKTAAEYSQSLLKTWGLSDPRIEPWEFGRGWTLEKQTVEMIEPS